MPEVLAGEIKTGIEIKEIQAENEEVKLFLLADLMLYYTKKIP